MKIFRTLASSMISFVIFVVSASAATYPPFSDNNGTSVPPGEYSGPYFKLSHDYPQTAPVPPMPWRSAIQNGVITTANASIYADALKQSVSKDMVTLIQNYANWDAAKAGWYNEPWLGDLREPIHGMYVGSSEFDPSLFVQSGLSKPISTYVLTYYNKTAAATLNKVWGKTAMKPAINTQATQYSEGSVIVKASFITADGNVWPPMKGALTWPVYISTNATTNPPPDFTVNPPVLTNASFMQFDIIVKDSKSAPKTGWVFTTLVFDNRLNQGANGIWDQMVVLGAQWGNDPQANNPGDPYPVLIENWNNPLAPVYGSETLGWGQRLSGPNDGAMNNYAYISGTRSQLPNAKPGATVYVTNGKNSSCMSCHSSAQWNTKNPALGMPSFLLPLMTARPQPPAGCVGDDQCNSLNSPVPGSPLWMKWFKNRLGTQPMDAGSVSGDFDMVLTFKSLPAWYAATTSKTHSLLRLDLRGKKLKHKSEAQPAE